MCGIAGFLEREGHAPDADVLRRMTEILHHRGPDSGGAVAGEGVKEIHAQVPE